MNGVLLLDRAQHAGDHGLAGGHAERTRHEAEILRGGNDRQAFERAFADEDGVIELGRGLGVPQPVGSSGGRREISADRAGRPAPRLAAYSPPSKRCCRRCVAIHAHVEVGAGDDELVGLEVLVEDHLPGLRAFDPHIVRHLALRGQEAADLRDGQRC